MPVEKYRLQPVLGAREQAKREAERLLAARMAQLAEAEEELARCAAGARRSAPSRASRSSRSAPSGAGVKDI